MSGQAEEAIETARQQVADLVHAAPQARQFKTLAAAYSYLRTFLDYRAPINTPSRYL